MNIMIVGSSGMVGQGVLNACLQANDVKRITLLIRKPQTISQDQDKIEQIVLPDLMQFNAQHPQLAELDACFFCAGVSSLGMNETDYRKMTYDLTLHIANILASVRPHLYFIYISGKGADSTSNTMWAKVRGETENALLALPLKTTIFRPAFIMAEKGIQSKTALYALMYQVMRPIVSAINTIIPLNLLTTAGIGNAMLNTVRHGSPKAILESQDIVQQAKKRV
ncbi:hypothetical protein [Avibacterium avium]|uniref:hypothetical protein n=1 Tax=Avibacterium avium TaxID=751 RepID=UPI003BF8A703